MKRILFSILISLVLIIFYLVLASIFFIASGQNPDIVPYVDLPLRLPKVIFYYFSPPIAQDYSMEFSQKKIYLSLISFFINILLYSIPIYFLLNVFSRFRVNKIKSINPPPPPEFK